MKGIKKYMGKYKWPLIVFEGIDKVGKTTLHREFDKYVNYKYLTCDRLFLTYLAYSTRYKRQVEVDSFYKWFEQDNEIIIINIIASEETLLKRFKDTNHKKINIKKDLRSFEKAILVLSDLGVKIININTENSKPIESVKEILKQIVG